MRNDITRRDALALGLSAATIAATGVAAHAQSAIKAADVPAPKLPIEKGASLRMLRPVRFVQADEDVFRALARPGALEILQAFNAIADLPARMALLALVREMAASSSGEHGNGGA